MTQPTTKPCTDGHRWTKTGACECGELRRCCAVYRSGKKCRARACTDGWCAPHAAVVSLAFKALKDSDK